MKYTCPAPWLVLACLLLAAQVAGAEGSPGAGESGHASGRQEKVEMVYIVSDYRYDPEGSDGDPDTGHALCGVRCNALSVDYLNYLKTPGWRMIRTAADVELTVELRNPFLDGQCICVADEYLVKVNDLFMAK